MDTSYLRYLELSIVHFMAFPETIAGDGPILETLEVIINDPFFTAIELGQIHDASVRKQAKLLLEQSHLKISFGAQPVVLLNKLNPNSEDAAERKRAMTYLRQAIDQAAELGAKRMGLLSGPNPVNPASRKNQTKIFIDFLNELSSYALAQGLEGLSLETFDFDVDKRALIGSNTDAAHLANFVRQDNPGFGLMVDLSHLPLQHESIDTALDAVKDSLVHAHLGNCVLDPQSPAFGDQHPRFGFPGGENDTAEVQAFLDKLFDIGFLGSEKRPFVGFEVKPQPGESSKAVIANAKRVFSEAWSQLHDINGREFGGAASEGIRLTKNLS